MSQLPGASLIPMTDAQRLALYEQCEAAILTGNQSYTVDGMTFTRANLTEVRRAIMELRQSMAGAVSGSLGGIRTTQVIF